jgi:hypothetical protein
VKVVEDAEVAEVKGVDVVVTEEPTIPEVVPVAMAVEESRNQMIGAVGTVVFLGTRSRNVGNYNTNNGNRNANRVKTKSTITSQIHTPRWYVSYCTSHDGNSIPSLHIYNWE